VFVYSPLRSPILLGYHRIHTGPKKSPTATTPSSTRSMQIAFPGQDIFSDVVISHPLLRSRRKVLVTMHVVSEELSAPSVNPIGGRGRRETLQQTHASFFNITTRIRALVTTSRPRSSSASSPAEVASLVDLTYIPAIDFCVDDLWTTCYPEQDANHSAQHRPVAASTFSILSAVETSIGDVVTTRRPSVSMTNTALTAHIDEAMRAAPPVTCRGRRTRGPFIEMLR
jgi:hypothetical protein